MEKLGMKDATEVLIGGSSAGGNAMLYWTDYFATYFD